MITIIDVLKRFYPNTEWGCDESTYAGLHWIDKIHAKPTEEEINSKIAELEAAEPMRLLRQELNLRLVETDWRATVDYPGSDKQSWLDYRKALRDLPATAEPKLENGQLTNITWPEVPE